VQRVDRLVADQRLVDQRASRSPAPVAMHLLPGQAAHLEDAGLELLELDWKCRTTRSVVHQPNLPVT
jgi:hypothetical protein